MHDNGFAKIVLRQADCEDGRSLRLHIWPAGEGTGGNVHSHRWDFTSLVIEGSLCFEEFEFDANEGLLALHYKYARPGGLEYELQPQGEVLLRRTCNGSRLRGEVYEMSAETLHRTWGAPGERTITLVWQGRHRIGAADVCVVDGGEPATRVSNRELAPSQVRQLLAAALAAT